MNKTFDAIFIGGGAAGFYGAIHLAMLGNYTICIVEKSTKVLQKVRISGGGRCNVTHYNFDPDYIASHYPRGAKFLKNLLQRHGPKHVLDFFSKAGVALKRETDNRVFPSSDRSETIIQCFMQRVALHKIEVKTQMSICSIKKINDIWELTDITGRKIWAHAVCIASGGMTNFQHYSWISSNNILIRMPLPSLFTFNAASKKMAFLQGISVEAHIEIEGFSITEQGPVLFTHWGLSGPAVIRLSAWAAEYLFHLQYDYTVCINFVPAYDAYTTLQILKNQTVGTTKLISNLNIFKLPARLWEYLLICSEIDPQKKAAEVSHKKWQQLANALTKFSVPCSGKTTFKEEFVTCGGIDLDMVDTDTMAIKTEKGLFAAGEVLNIDGLTGGFNFQAAWTTAFVAAHGMHTYLQEILNQKR